MFLNSDLWWKPSPVTTVWNQDLDVNDVHPMFFLHQILAYTIFTSTPSTRTFEVETKKMLFLYTHKVRAFLKLCFWNAITNCTPNPKYSPKLLLLQCYRAPHRADYTGSGRQARGNHRTGHFKPLNERVKNIPIKLMHQRAYFKKE